MPPRKKSLTQKAQSERFRKAAQDLIDAGELSLTDAGAAMDKLVRKQQKHPLDEG